jgi:branched-chain amino acid transport system substrate-binding protein
MRAGDHQFVTPLVVSRVARGAKYPVDGTDLGFVPVARVPAEELIYPVQASCAMVRPT